MSSQILHGVAREIRSIPDEAFLEAMRNMPARMSPRLAFMTRDHHLVRDFAVRELPRHEQPLPPEHIAQTAGLELENIISILADLEQHLFFLVRNSAGHVSWAFPVTAEPTPHRLTFSTGEKIFGA
jgi:hypothetical protein